MNLVQSTFGKSTNAIRIVQLKPISYRALRLSYFQNIGGQKIHCSLIFSLLYLFTNLFTQKTNRPTMTLWSGSIIRNLNFLFRFPIQLHSSRLNSSQKKITFRPFKDYEQDFNLLIRKRIKVFKTHLPSILFRNSFPANHPPFFCLNWNNFHFRTSVQYTVCIDNDNVTEVTCINLHETRVLLIFLWY